MELQELKSEHLSRFDVGVYISMWLITIATGVLTGNTIGASVMLVGVSVILSICSRIFKTNANTLCVAGTVALFLGSFFYLGSEDVGRYRKNGVCIAAPFVVIPFYDKIEPMVESLEVTVQHTSTIYSFDPGKAEPRTVTIRASVTAKSKDGELFVLAVAKLEDEVKGRIRNMFVTGNDVDGYAKLAAQSLREGLEKEFPKLYFSGNLHIAHHAYAHSAM